MKRKTLCIFSHSSQISSRCQAFGRVHFKEIFLLIM
ncbi:unnamed protein product [Coffea canephora]|uniref:Uncharacterized protein n=1 Tax=Coffea canephora TaxID=49390 RepID=A0A068UXX3_COFCA|nr:unnamed protein product [Coffea canephora]